MNKKLRLSMLTLLVALFSTVGMAKNVVFNFDDDYASLFPGMGLSSNDAHDGDFTEATTATLDGIAITVSPAEEGVKYANRLWNGKNKLRMYSGTLTITSPEGVKITALTITQGKWNEGNTADNGTLTSDGWTGDPTNKIVINIAGNSQMKEITVVTDQGGTDPEPVKNKYVKATTVESGKAYLIAANEEGTFKVADVINGDYGFLYVDNAEAADNVIELAPDNTNEFTFTATEGGYYIQQADGKYLGMDGSHDSFQISDDKAANSPVWSVEAQADGTFIIKNVTTNKYVQFSQQYGSYGSYADEKGLLPYLFVKSDANSVKDVTTVAKKALDKNAPMYNLAGQRVGASYKGIVLQNGNKYIVK